MIPISITDVTSLSTLARSAEAFPAGCQYGHAATSTPTAASIFDPHNANADVTPHGRPAKTSVAIFTTARPSAPATSGHGPRSHARRGGPSRPNAVRTLRAGRRSDDVPCRRLSITHE